jgi:hypothetical protein
VSTPTSQHQEASGRIPKHQKPCFPGVFAPSKVEGLNPPSHQDASASIPKHPLRATGALPDARPVDPDLALINAAWDRLPAAVKAGIVAMVQAAAK